MSVDVNSQNHQFSEVNHPLLFEMIRSFVALARTLNLSHAVAELNSTRQTVRRHIQHLEDLRGEKLFEVVSRRYELTEQGRSALPTAIDLLLRAKAWGKGQINVQDGLQVLQAQTESWVFLQQQQPMGLIWKSDNLLLRETFRAWTMACGLIENPSLLHVRPYLMVYRHTAAGWICVEFGRKSAYVNWFGWDFARSSIGRPLTRLPAGEEFGHMLDQSFHEVQATQLARLDHVFTRMPRPIADGQATIAYQRLMMAGFFPDQSPAVLSLVVPTDDIQIDTLTESHRTLLESISPPSFETRDAKFERATL